MNKLIITKIMIQTMKNTLMILTLTFFLITGCVNSDSNQTDAELTEYFQNQEKTVIKNAAITEINSIINESLKSGNETQRLNKIADLITNNYSNGLWDHDSYQLFKNSQKYEYNKNGQVWIIRVDDSNSNLATDPNWLIYQKAGACRELSTIFNDITTKSGFSSRIVRTGNGDNFGRNATHWWNEIVIGGINKTFDIQLYGQIKYNVSNRLSWSGNRSDFFNNSDGFGPQQLCNANGVWITDKDGNKIEDITTDYCHPIIE